MSYDLKMWNWLAPGIIAGFLLGIAMWLVASSLPMGSYCAGSLMFAVILLIVQTISGYRAYYHQIETDQYVARRNAMANTAEVKKFEYSQQMHPEALRLLLRHNVEVWRIMEMPANEILLPVLDADPRITLPFIEHVLRNSNTYYIMANRGLSDKAHTFDPRRLFTDYEQYKALHTLLEGRGWLTTAFGNQPGQWIEPWKPELVARRFGVNILTEEEEQSEEKSVEVQKS